MAPEGRGDWCPVYGTRCWLGNDPAWAHGPAPSPGAAPSPCVAPNPGMAPGPCGTASPGMTPAPCEAPMPGAASGPCDAASAGAAPRPGVAPSPVQRPNCSPNLLDICRSGTLCPGSRVGRTGPGVGPCTNPCPCLWPGPNNALTPGGGGSATPSAARVTAAAAEAAAGGAAEVMGPTLPGLLQGSTLGAVCP